MHGYVFWRLASVPWVADHVAPSALVGRPGPGGSFPLARLLNARRLAVVGRPLEFVAANWVGVLFLLLAMLLAADAVTLGGWLFPGSLPACAARRDRRAAAGRRCAWCRGCGRRS